MGKKIDPEIAEKALLSQITTIALDQYAVANKLEIDDESCANLVERVANIIHPVQISLVESLFDEFLDLDEDDDDPPEED